MVLSPRNLKKSMPTKTVEVKFSNVNIDSEMRRPRMNKMAATDEMRQTKLNVTLPSIASVNAE